MKYLKWILCLLVIVCVVWPDFSDASSRRRRFLLAVIAAKGGGASNQKFYSDFNDEADDGQWVGDAAPSGWSDDETTSPSPLEGAQSLSTVDTVVGRTHTTDSFGPVSGTVYKRMSFRVVDGGDSSGDSAIHLRFEDSSNNELAECYMFWHNTNSNYYRLYADDGGSNTANVSPSSPVAFDDGTYCMVGTYTPSTSVKCDITDCAGNVVEAGAVDYTVTTSGAATSAAVDHLDIQAVTGGVDWDMDEVEVRTDTSWGS